MSHEVRHVLDRGLDRLLAADRLVVRGRVGGWLVMRPHESDAPRERSPVMPTWRILEGDCGDQLSTVQAGSVRTCVTSPPYYWARDYGHDEQLGHEDDPGQYVAALVDRLAAVRRTLAEDGTLWLNIGDTYYSGNGQPRGSDPRSPSRNFMRTKRRAVDRSGWSIPKKSLIGIPWRVALALQADGWTLRSAIVWDRCNAFVEASVRDRPYRRYEHLFLLSRARRYYFDREHVAEHEDVWRIAATAVKGHAAAFPVELAVRCVLAGSRAGDMVLDPFAGSGTTGIAALRHGRSFIGCELNSEYARLARDRIVADSPLFNAHAEVRA